MATSEKDAKYDEAHSSGEKRGSIYQFIPPGERRMSAQGRRVSVVDDIFGEIKEGGPNYRNVIFTIYRHDQCIDWIRLDGLELPS